MSRLANVPITIPSGLKVSVEQEQGISKLLISNGKVSESWQLHKCVEVSTSDTEIVFSMSDEDRANKFNRSMLGTDYRHVANLVSGLATPFKTVLEIHGLGYRVKQSGNKLILSLGKSHDDDVIVPEHVHAEVPNEKEIICSSHSKKILGDFVAELCSKRRPDAYKAKGVRIKGKHYRTKD